MIIIIIKLRIKCIFVWINIFYFEVFLHIYFSSYTINYNNTFVNTLNNEL